MCLEVGVIQLAHDLRVAVDERDAAVECGGMAVEHQQQCQAKVMQVSGFAQIHHDIGGGGIIRKMTGFTEKMMGADIETLPDFDDYDITVRCLLYLHLHRAIPF